MNGKSIAMLDNFFNFFYNSHLSAPLPHLSVTYCLCWWNKMLTTMQHCLEGDRGISGNLLSMNYKILFIILSEGL